MKKKLFVILLAILFLLIYTSPNQAMIIKNLGVTLTYPKEGDIVSGTITIRWYSIPRDIDVYLYVDLNKIAGPINGITEYEWNTTSVSEGYHEIIISIKDGSYFDSDSSGPFLVNNVDEPPNTPERPNGPSKIKPGINYIYSTVTTDPDEDDVYYQWKWGIYSGEIIDIESTSEPMGPYGSGELAEANRTWEAALNQTVTIRVKAIDEDGMESDWSEPLSAIVPKNKIIDNLPNLRNSKETFHIKNLINYFLYLVKEKI